MVFRRVVCPQVLSNPEFLAEGTAIKDLQVRHSPRQFSAHSLHHPAAVFRDNGHTNACASFAPMAGTPQLVSTGPACDLS